MALTSRPRPESGDETASAIAREIERYVAAHPEAADTVAGIRQWWLPECFTDTPTSIVEAALETLLVRGAVVSTPLADGQILYAGGGSSGRMEHR